MLDPFCGRGTTNFAARLLGLSSVGVDSSPVATAITAAKLVSVAPEAIVAEAKEILSGRTATSCPAGDFWDLAFHREVLTSLCRVRDALLDDCNSSERIALRAIVLGALHGPKQKTVPGYLSNQSPRTFAPKPAYAVRFWTRHGVLPEKVDVLQLIQRRAHRYFGILRSADSQVRNADSRQPESVAPITRRRKFNWIITSPPYYGMKTYIADQWLRNWFVGGPDVVDYSSERQVAHTSPETFADDLRYVWRNSHDSCSEDAKLVIRFGGISDRKVDPLNLLKASLRGSGWRITTVRKAGTAKEGKRQADAFLLRNTIPVAEFDVWARKA